MMGPSARKIPRMDTDEDVHSSINLALGPKQARDEVPEDINYFTQSHLDVWPEILDYLTEEADIKSVLNASHLFSTVWGSRKVTALFPLVVPLLLKTNYLDRENILSCRLVNKKTKLSVDDVITKSQPVWLPSLFTFEDDNDIENFMNHFESQNVHVSPFISKYCHVIAQDQDCFDRTVDMLTEFGHSLHTFVFGMSFNDSRPLPLMDGLVEILELVPNLQVLVLKFPSYDIEFEDDWQRFRRRRGTCFPPLETLTELELQVGEITEEENYIPGVFIKPIIKAYGKQLKKFKSDGFLLQDFDAEFLTTNLYNLCTFQIHENYSEVDGFILAHEKLSQVGWPKLESLTLAGFTCHTNQTFEALNHFRDNLTELRFGSLESQNFDLRDIDPLDVLPFPKLVRLTVDMDEVNSALWHFFRNQFVNLEILRFESKDDESLSGDDDPIIRSVPSATVRKRFFTIFPKLHSILWADGRGDSKCLRVSPL